MQTITQGLNDVYANRAILVWPILLATAGITILVGG